jgi:Mrp family chromosome partitioning ATPase
LDPKISSPKQVAGILNLPTDGWIPTRPRRGGALSYLTVGLRKLLVQLKANNSASSSVLVVVSPGTKDGKSTVCYAMAQSLADMGSRVALIDANFSRPYQHILFNQQASPGLIDCIGAQEANQALKYMKPVGPNLALLPAGQHLDDGRISLKEVTAVIEQLRSDFDFVIVDSRASGLTFDGLTLPDCEHRVIIVSRLCCTRKSSLRLLAAQLQMRPEITAHSVVNDIDEQSIASNLMADAALMSNSPIEKQSAPADPTSVATW